MFIVFVVDWQTMKIKFTKSKPKCTLLLLGTSIYEITLTLSTCSRIMSLAKDGYTLSKIQDHLTNEQCMYPKRQEIALLDPGKVSYMMGLSSGPLYCTCEKEDH